MSRAQRLAGLLKQEISGIISTQIRDQRIGFVSITDIEVSEDLGAAKVYFSCLGDDKEKGRSLRGLRSAKSYIRSLLAKKLILRQVPELSFIPDDSLERGARVIEILNKLKPESQGKAE